MWSQLFQNITNNNNNNNLCLRNKSQIKNNLLLERRVKKERFYLYHPLKFLKISKRIRLRAEPKGEEDVGKKEAAWVHTLVIYCWDSKSWK